MDVSSVSSFYEPPVEYDEGKTIELYEKLKTNFQDVEASLGVVQRNLLMVQKESTLTVKLIEKLKSVQEPVENQNENQNENHNSKQLRKKTRSSK